MLYKFVGYRLVQGENPFYLNYEAPPFAKYLYGLAEYFIGNPYWVSLGMYLGTLEILYLFSRTLFKDQKYSLLILMLFVTTPFVATQVRDTMLDLPLMFLLLTHTFFFAKYLLDKKFLFLALAGIFLGLATGTKIGIYTPWVFLLGVPLVIFSSTALRRIINPLFYLAAIFTGYVLSYISYFLHHPNPIPWLKLHEKQLDFYLKNESNVDYLNQWRGIFMNTYEGWWKMGQTSFGDWSPLLPLGVIAAFIVFILSVRKKEKVWIYVSGTTIIFLIVNSLIDFFPRYLMPAVPGFILLIGYFSKKFWIILIFLALLNLPFLMSSLVTKDYISNSKAAADFVSKRAYRELYRSIDPKQLKTLNEEEFIKTLENFYETIRADKIDVNIGQIKRTGSGLQVASNVKYITEFGEIKNEMPWEFIDSNNQTRLVWKWDYLWPGYLPNKKIIIETHKITVPKNPQIYRPGKVEKVYIITRHVKWPTTLDRLSEVVEKMGGVEVGERLRWSIPDDFPRYVGILNENLGEEGRKKALDIKGVKLREVNLDILTDIYFDRGGEREYIIKSAPVDYKKL